jgi:hypothetical protein
MLTNLTQDFRFAGRMLWRNRGFAASTMLILTLGIAASTGLFAVIDAVVLHPLPYAGADRIARVRLVTPSGQPQEAMVSAEQFSATCTNWRDIANLPILRRPRRLRLQRSWRAIEPRSGNVL